ncbi:MAG: PhzF family phenazine biosynthesis protein [Sphingomonadaceae bacterium]|nr:PhzF family phenazine biosynthesis protein [Sphingomonadaceae bacterium]
MSAPRFAFVNAFSTAPFGGNPAAVVWSDAPLPDTACAAIAREVALPATAFVAGETLSLRWFNASGELALCGHGTLAAAHVLREAGRLADGVTLTFAAPSGPLAVRAEGELLWLTLLAATPRPAAPDSRVATALGVAPVAMARGALDLIVELASEADVAGLRPDFAALRGIDTRGIIVTAPAAGDADYVMRFFAPRLGIDEDAVTATAHAAIAPLWTARLGQAALTGRQLSARGGLVRSRTGVGMVEIAGTAVTLIAGELRSGWA